MVNYYCESVICVSTMGWRPRGINLIEERPGGGTGQYRAGLYPHNSTAGHFSCTPPALTRHSATAGLVFIGSAVSGTSVRGAMPLCRPSRLCRCHRPHVPRSGSLLWIPDVHQALQGHTTKQGTHVNSPGLDIGSSLS